MRYNSYRDPGRDAADGGLFDSELVLKPPPPFTPEPQADDGADEEALRLAPLRDYEPPLRRARGPSRRVLVLSGWALALTVALGAGYMIQTLRQPVNDADAPPAVAPAPDSLGAPVTAAPIASDPDRFTQAQAAPEVNAPAADGAVQAANPDGSPEAASPIPAPAQTVPASEPVKAKAPLPADEADAGPVKARAAETRKAAGPDTPKAEAKLAAPDKKPATEKAKLTEATDLPQLKARMSRAYAQAVKAGTPKTVLKARQTEWASLYAKAEKKGPAAVAALYRTRAAQLEAIARKSAKGRGKA